MTEPVVLELAGREVRITSPDKVFFPKRGETKLDLVRFYEAVEEPIMARMRGRPTLMERYPDGARGKSFFQKRVPKGAPDWLETTVVVTPAGTTSNALVARDLAHLAWAMNMGCLGFHVWPYKVFDPEHADELRIDLDPSPGVGFDRSVRPPTRFGTCSTSSTSGRSSRPVAPRACTSTPSCTPGGTPTGYGPRLSPWPGSWRGAGPI